MTDATEHDDHRCAEQSPKGQQCGNPAGHDGAHTFDAEPAEMLINLIPAQVVRMVGKCPGCLARFDQVIPIPVANMLQLGREVGVECNACGQKCKVSKRQLLDAKLQPQMGMPGPGTPGRNGKPKLVLAKR